MSNEFKLVPVEPTEEMIFWIATGAHRGDSGKEIWSEALAHAPQPPALGDDLDHAPLQAEITHQNNLRIEAQDFADQLKARCDELEGLIRELPYELRGLSGSENTAGVEACVEYVEQIAIAALSKAAVNNQ